MNKLLCCLMLLPCMLVAQDFRNMSPEDMEKMAAQAREAQDCMAKVDQQELEKLRVRADEMIEEVNALCESGDKTAARAAAVAHAKELEKKPVMQQIKECSGLIKQQIPALVWSELEEPGSKNTDVCEVGR